MTTEVLITGGAGFIGSHLAAAWSSRGARVRILDNFRTGHRRNLEGIDCQLFEGSIEDADLVYRAMQGVTYVHHLAALVSVPESMQQPRVANRLNIDGTLNVLDAARLCGVRKVVYSSTSAVYGQIDRPMHGETDLPAPASPYAIAKLAGEHYMALFAEAYQVPTVTLRYFNVYGPRQDPNSPYAAAVAIFAARARANQAITIFGDGEQTRDFVYVEDVARANMLAAEQGTGVYNVACGGRITINDLARDIVALSGSSSPIEHRPPRDGDIRFSCGSAAKISALGWKPEVSLREGLGRTLAVLVS